MGGILCISATQFFFFQKFTTWHIDHHPILFFFFNSKQNTEAKTQQNYHTHRGDDWRLTTVLLKTMAGVGRQFILLLWKNWLLQKRKACVTVFEIVMPIVFAVILVCIRLIAKNETISQSTIWPPFKPNDVLLRGSQIEILYSPNTTDIQTMMNTSRNFLPGLGITLDIFFPSFMFLFLIFTYLLVLLKFCFGLTQNNYFKTFLQSPMEASGMVNMALIW